VTLAGPTIVGNALIITAILKTTSLRTPGFILLTGLAVSDLGIGILGLLIQGILDCMDHNSRLVENVMYTIQVYFAGVSQLTLLAVSGDRVFALTFHLRYVSMVTSTRATVVLFSVWVVAALHCWMP
ncbi:predicted protein, partial [Nematostella vectensis]